MVFSSDSKALLSSSCFVFGWEGGDEEGRPGVVMLTVIALLFGLLLLLLFELTFTVAYNFDFLIAYPR
jgi:hypothetical protein